MAGVYNSTVNGLSWLPEPPLRFPRFALIAAKFFQVFERELGVGVPVTLLDDLRIQKRAVLQVDVGQGAPEAVNPVLVILQPNFLAFRHSFREGRGFFAEPLHRTARVHSFGSVHPDQPYPFVAVEKQGVPIDYPDNPAPLNALLRSGRTSKA